MVKKGQKDIFSSQFFTRKSLEVFLDHLRLKTKICKKCPIFVERVPYQKMGFLYFWKCQTEWFSPKLNHVSEIWWFEKLLFNKPDFTRLSKLVKKIVNKKCLPPSFDCCRQKNSLQRNFSPNGVQNGDVLFEIYQNPDFRHHHLNVHAYDVSIHRPNDLIFHPEVTKKY